DPKWVLYGVLILEPKQQNKDPKYINLMEEIADSVINTYYQDIKQGKVQEPITFRQKAFDILAELNLEKHKDWVNTINALKKNDNNNAKSGQTLNANLNETLRITDTTKGLVYIQYNDESKKEQVRQFRKKLSEKSWNVPGEEFIPKSKSDYKVNQIRFFNETDKKLAEQLKTETEKSLNCTGCFSIKKFSKNYPNVKQGQLEIWINFEDERFRS
ncbi:MAG TPA: hypothetical protein DCF68_05750, partial [Cyanothece sp. UBA12306]|nr:hypothetical protein [Cyanothece sp. UBA12306]